MKTLNTLLLTATLLCAGSAFADTTFTWSPPPDAGPPMPLNPPPAGFVTPVSSNGSCDTNYTRAGNNCFYVVNNQSLCPGGSVTNDGAECYAVANDGSLFPLGPTGMPEDSSSWQTWDNSVTPAVSVPFTADQISQAVSNLQTVAAGGTVGSSTSSNGSTPSTGANSMSSALFGNKTSSAFVDIEIALAAAAGLILGILGIVHGYRAIKRLFEPKAPVRLRDFVVLSEREKYQIRRYGRIKYPSTKTFNGNYVPPSNRHKKSFRK